MTENTLPQQRKRPWLRRMLGIGAALLLLYWGYCWGWWFRDNLLVQAIFQCTCPTVSENARYAPFRVVASACHNPVVVRSPTGTHVLLLETIQGTAQAKLITDTRTGAGMTLSPQTASSLQQKYLALLTDTLLYEASFRDYFLVELGSTPPRTTALEDVDWWFFIQQAPNPGILYYQVEGPIVFMAATPEHHSYNIRTNLSLQEVQDWGQQYHIPIIVNRAMPFDAQSHPWRLVEQGIINRDTRSLLSSKVRATDIAPFWPVGWVDDDHTILFTYGRDPYLIRGGYGSPLTPPLNFFYVPQPILARDVPEELLSATPSATP